MQSGFNKVNGKLHDMLNNPNLTVQMLFQVKNIILEIKQNIQVFLTFCLKRRQFTTQMLQIYLDSTYQFLQNQNNKEIAYNISELMSCDEDALGKFFFFEQESSKTNSDIQQKITQQPKDDIITDAELLFGDYQQNKNYQWIKEPDVFEKYQLIKISLNILKNPLKNQSCLGYIKKIYSSLLKRQSSHFLQFLSLNKQYLDMILKGMQHYAIGNLLITILSAQDKSGQYKYQDLKKYIFQQILKITFSSIQDKQKFEGILMMIQQIINTTKQSYYEYFDDFKRCANILVSEQTLKKFLVFVQKSQVNSFRNALTYLQLILRRRNIQNNQNLNDCCHQNDSYPSMNFQYTFLYSEIDTFIKIGYKMIDGQQEPFTKMLFFSFLLELLKNREGKQKNLNYLELFKDFIKMLVLEKGHGIVKNYIYQLADICLKEIQTQDIKQIIDWLFFHSDGQIKQQIKKINPFDNLININKDQKKCFTQKLILNLKEKVKINGKIKDDSKQILNQISKGQGYKKNNLKYNFPKTKKLNKQELVKIISLFLPQIYQLTMRQKLLFNNSKYKEYRQLIS